MRASLLGSLAALGVGLAAAQAQASLDVGAKAAVLEERDIASDILEDLIATFEHAADCAGCEAALTVLQGLSVLGDEVFVSIVTEVCVLSKVWTLVVPVVGRQACRLLCGIRLDD
jgi:hypothetical protein